MSRNIYAKAAETSAEQSDRLGMAVLWRSCGSLVKGSGLELARAGLSSGYGCKIDVGWSSGE